MKAKSFFLSLRLTFKNKQSTFNLRSYVNSFFPNLKTATLNKFLHTPLSRKRNLIFSDFLILS